MKNLLYILLLASLISCSKKVYPTLPFSENFSTIEEPQESKIIIPIDIPLNTLHSYVNQKLPRGIIYQTGNVPQGNSKRYSIDVIRERDIQMFGDSTGIRFRVPITVKAKGQVKLCFGWWTGHWRCTGGSDTRTAHSKVDVAIDLRVNPELNPDWSISTNTSIDASIINNPHLSFHLLGFQFHINIKSFLNNYLDKFIRENKDNLNAKVNEAVTNFDLKKQVNEFWERAGHPIEIKDLNYYLNSKPVSIYFQNIIMDKDNLKFRIGFGSKLQLAEKKEINKSVLPDITILESDQKGKLLINPNMSVSFNRLTSELNKRFKDSIVKFRKYKLKINDINLSGFSKNGQESILTSVNFKCTKGFLARGVKGIIYLNAIPRYDKLNNRLYVEDFELTTETKNKLADISSHFLANKVFYKNILKSLSKDFTEDKIKITNSIKESIAEIKMKDLVIKGDLLKFNIENLKLSKDYITVRSKLEADLQTESIHSETPIVSSN